MSMFNPPHYTGARQPAQYVLPPEQPSTNGQTSQQVSPQQIQYQQQPQPLERHPEASRFPPSPSIHHAQQTGLNNHAQQQQQQQQQSTTTMQTSGQQETSATSPVVTNSTATQQSQPTQQLPSPSNAVSELQPTYPTAPPPTSETPSHLANAYPFTSTLRTIPTDSATPPSKRSRGRPRKWAREEDRRAAEAQRRRDTNKAKKYGLPMPPRPVGTYVPPPGDATDPNRGPYVYFDKDYGHHTPGTEGALTARDVIVNWLARDGNWNRWNKWSVPERETVCRELQAEMAGHGMCEREILSIRQQVSFLQRGARDARRFEVEGPTTELLRAAVAEEPLLPITISETSHPDGDEGPTAAPAPDPHADVGHLDMMDLGAMHDSPSAVALAHTTLGQALRSVEPWRGSQEPSEQELAEVTSRANQLLGGPSPLTPSAANNAAHRPPTGSGGRVLTKREAEAWELEKLQIKQKLELEKEDRRAKEKISERELHLQSIKAFRELLQDGLTRNQAGSLVFAEDWPRIKAQWESEAE
ncbi:hypothetical protein NliqN6_6524 [Naganishia liquefaciens]|uniref:Uncharacterized protein n=1 Tax=Naganishia liquefaciens TaxID=104408 RepID=A0A8H3TZU6_9TREE|nr:hypothetical protein NliqN6_6524 [Naganishia liquefaciens]